jgi:EAL domain-containing protein (putative c-di-GMP-specific phosphodiesterase class I)
MGGELARLLGLAFAAADLLIEVDGDGRVVFAAGSHPDPARESAEEMVGAHLSAWMDPEFQTIVHNQLKALRAGQRSAPLEAVMKAPTGGVRAVTLRALCLPFLAPNISCAISFSRHAEAGCGEQTLSREDFETRVLDTLNRTRSANEDLTCAFVEVRGLTNAAAGMGAAGMDAVQAIEALLKSKSLGGDAATHLEGDRYAVLGPDTLTARVLRDCIAAEARARGIEVAPAAGVTLLRKDVEPLANLRALRFTLDSFIRSGAGGDERALSKEFGQALHETLTSAAVFTRSVRERKFELHYQPIVSLEDRSVQHYEALARFKGQVSPAAAIRMAEELDIVTDFDLAVVDKALNRLRSAEAGVRLALNMSARSIAEERFAAEVLRMTDKRPELRQRLLFEVTESAALDDLEGAARRLGALRDAGCTICIDDFGAGSASFDYLRELPVDMVKIDGKFVKSIETDERTQTMIKGLVDLCSALGVGTVAEMIESEAQCSRLKALGVQFGQGWLFGRPNPALQRAPAPAAARRKGVVETWG